MGLNKVEVQGKLGKDPELRRTAGGDAFCKFSMAVTTRYKDKKGQKQEIVYWANVVAWRNLAEICAQYLVKGQEVIIVGKLTGNQWEKDGQKHYATDITAEEMHFCGPAPAKGEPDDDIPF
jgi:single-strand DNA-binding protein